MREGKASTVLPRDAHDEGRSWIKQNVDKPRQEGKGFGDNFKLLRYSILDSCVRVSEV